MTVGHATCSTHTKYLLSCEDFDGLLKRADDRCEVCCTHWNDAATGRLFIDHDHQRGVAAVRGLLCMGCNFILGQVDAGKPAPAHLADQVQRYLANPWVTEVPIEVNAHKRNEQGELVIGDEMSTAQLRAKISDVIHASAVHHRVTYVTKHGRRIAAIAPVGVAEEAEAARVGNLQRLIARLQSAGYIVRLRDEQT